MTTPPSPPATDADLDAARLLLSRMGINPADLLGTHRRQAAPSFAEYIPIVATAVSQATLSVYGPYWNYVAAGPPRGTFGARSVVT